MELVAPSPANPAVVSGEAMLGLSEIMADVRRPVLGALSAILAPGVA